MVSLWDMSITIMAIFSAWAMYSSLYGKPNPFRSFTEVVYVGMSSAISVVASVSYIRRTAVTNALQGDIGMIFAIVLGLLLLTRFYPPLRDLSKLTMAITIGTGLGLSLRTTPESGILRRVAALAVPFIIEGDLYKTLLQTTILVSMLTMITFFLYTTEIKGPLKVSYTIGEYCLYMAFGQLFASTLQGRLGLLIGFMQFITSPAWKIPYAIGIPILLLAAIIILDRMNLLEKYSH